MPERLPSCLNALDGNMAIIGRNLDWIGLAVARLAAKVAVRGESEDTVV